jgi:hypothetical protein
MPDLETRLRDLMELTRPTTPPLSAEELRRRAGAPRRRSRAGLTVAAAVLVALLLGGVVVVARSEGSLPAGAGGSTTRSPETTAVLAYAVVNVEARRSLQRESLAVARVSGSSSREGMAELKTQEAATDRAVNALRTAGAALPGTDRVKDANSYLEGRLLSLMSLRKSVELAQTDAMALGGEYTQIIEAAIAGTAATAISVVPPDDVATLDLLQTATAVGSMANRTTAALSLLEIAAEVGFFPETLPRMAQPASRLDNFGRGCGDLSNLLDSANQECTILRMFEDEARTASPPRPGYQLTPANRRVSYLWPAREIDDLVAAAADGARHNGNDLAAAGVTSDRVVAVAEARIDQLAEAERALVAG